jgi:hypothetical protein
MSPNVSITRFCTFPQKRSVTLVDGRVSVNCDNERRTESGNVYFSGIFRPILLCL